MLRTHSKVEELLEAHLMDVDSLATKINYLLVLLQNADASVSRSSVLILLLWNTVNIVPFMSVFTTCSIAIEIIKNPRPWIPHYMYHCWNSSGHNDCSIDDQGAVKPHMLLCVKELHQIYPSPLSLLW